MKDFISWNLIDECVTDITDHLALSDIKFEGVYGIPRGGAILAVMLSHKLDIPYITSSSLIREHTKSNIVIIDDIVDTGDTLKMYAEFKNAYFVTIHEHKQSKVKPQYSVLDKEDKWIVYPWEREDEEEMQDYLQ